MLRLTVRRGHTFIILDSNGKICEIVVNETHGGNVRLTINAKKEEFKIIRQGVLNKERQKNIEENRGNR